MKTFPKLTILAALAALFAFEAVAPAVAQPWGPPPPPPPWGGDGPPPPRHHRWGPPPPPPPRCWVEQRRVRVDTDYGPRWRVRDVRICR